MLVAACAEVNDAVWTEMERLKQVYAKVGKHFNRVDQRWGKMNLNKKSTEIWKIPKRIE